MSKKKKGSRYTRPTRHRVSQLVGTRMGFPDHDANGDIVIPPGDGPVVFAETGTPFVFSAREAAWIAEQTGLEVGLVTRLLDLQTMRPVSWDGRVSQAGDVESRLPPPGSGRQFGVLLGTFDRARIAGTDVDTARLVQEWNFRFLAEHDLAHRDAEGEWVAASVIRVQEEST